MKTLGGGGAGFVEQGQSEHERDITRRGVRIGIFYVGKFDNWLVGKIKKRVREKVIGSWN